MKAKRRKLQMPVRMPSDHEHVTALINESERCTNLGNCWMAAETPNALAADLCLRNGWAYSLAAAWLRCKLKGETK